jgi:hypothetical protein
MLNSPFDKVIADNEIETLRALYRQDTGAHPLVSVVLHPDVQQPAQIGVNTRRALRHVLNVFPDWARNLRPRRLGPAQASGKHHRDPGHRRDERRRSTRMCRLRPLIFLPAS